MIPVTHALRGEGFDASEDGTGRGTPLVPDIAWALQERDSKGSDSKGSDSSTKEGHLIPVEKQAVSFAQNQCGEVRVDDVASTINTNSNASGRNTPLAMHHAAVRRLTPLECERLQGFPDDYTRIPYRGRPAEDCPDGPRYKALGNSMAVPCMRWIGQRIQMVNNLANLAETMVSEVPR